MEASGRQYATGRTGDAGAGHQIFRADRKERIVPYLAI